MELAYPEFSSLAAPIFIVALKKMRWQSFGNSFYSLAVRVTKKSNVMASRLLFPSFLLSVAKIGKIRNVY